MEPITTAALITGGAMLGSAALGAFGGGSSGSQQTSQKLDNPNQTEQALAGQFGSLFMPTLSYNEFKNYFGPFLNGLNYSPVKYGSARLTNPQDAYQVYQAQPSQFTQWVQKEMGQAGQDLGPSPTPSGPQFDIGDSLSAYISGMQRAGGGGSVGGGSGAPSGYITLPSTTGTAVGTSTGGATGAQTSAPSNQVGVDQLLGNYVSGTDQAFKEFQAGAIQAWNDWMAFEDKYDNLYEAIGPTYDQIVGEYKQNIGSIPELNLGLPGGGSIPLAPKVHSDMYGKQAITEAGIQGQKFGEQSDALKGQSMGLAARTNLLPAYYAAGSDAAGTNLNAANSLLNQQQIQNNASYQQGLLANQSNAMNIAANQAAAQANLAPIELGKWLLQRESNLRAGQGTTTTSYQQPTDYAGSMLSALAMSAPAIGQAVNNNPTNTGFQYQPVIQPNYGQNTATGNYGTYNVAPFDLGSLYYNNRY